MSHPRTRKLLVPALLASLIPALALPLTAGADHRQASDQGPSRGYHHGPRLDMMETLELSDDQREALREARATHRTDRQALQERHRAAIDEILSDEQRATLEAARQAHHGAHAGQWGERRQARLDALLDSWALSDDDRDALRDAREAMKDEVRALRDQTFASRDDKHAALQALRDEHRAALAEVLNEDQLHALEVIMNPRHGRHHGGHHGRGAHHHGDQPAPSAGKAPTDG